jgi:hypothetical protein
LENYGEAPAELIENMATRKGNRLERDTATDAFFSGLPGGVQAAAASRT